MLLAEIACILKYNVHGIMKSELYTVHTYTHITTAACFLNIGIVTGQHVKASVCESSSSIEPPLQNLVKAGTVFK